MEAKGSFSRPCVEELEARDVPSSTPLVGAFSSGTAFTVFDGAKHQAALSAFTNAAGQLAVTAQADGQSTTFLAPAGTTSLVLLGSQRAPNVIQNTTTLPAVEVGGRKSDTIFTGNGGTVGSPADLVLPGGGKDVVYSLVGVHTLVTAGGGSDLVITNPNNTVVADSRDQVVTFFAGGRTPGSGTVALVNGVLYISPTNNGSTTSVDYGPRDTVVLTTDLGDGNGPQTFTYSRQSVNFVAYFGGTGNDVFVNNTRIDQAAYGSGGNDTLISGFGSYALEKGSGGNDTLIGRARVNDLSANGGVDTLFALAGQGHNIFRTNAQTTVVGQARGDVVVSP